MRYDLKQVNLSKLRISELQKLKNDTFTPSKKVPTSQPEVRSIPFHKNRQIQPVNILIREMKRLGLEQFIKKYGKRVTLEISELVKMIDGQFRNLTGLKEPLTVYRGVQENVNKSSKSFFDKLFKANEGEEIIPDCGYTFTSLDKNIFRVYGTHAHHHSKAVHGRTAALKIRIPQNAKVSLTDDYNGEILLPRNAKFKIISKKINKNKSLEMELEYIVRKQGIKVSEIPPKLKAYKKRKNLEFSF